MVVDIGSMIGIRRQMVGRTVVFTCGSYDLIHPGHVDFLEYSKEQGDVLIVAINEDEFVRQKKGPNRPIQNMEDRMKMVDSLKAVDYVVPKELAENSRQGSVITAEKLQPDVIVLGHDWAAKEIDEWRERLPKAKIVIGLPREFGRSTTHLISHISDLHKTDNANSSES